MIRSTAILAMGLLSACAPENPGDAPAGTPTPGDTPLAQDSWTAPDHCPEWSDPNRPDGSNCLGIMPESCGADQAAAYVGQVITPRIDAILTRFAPGGIRVLRPDQARSDDLVEGRLNVFLGARDRIESVDCF